MKYIGVTALLSLALAGAASAQVDVKVMMDQDQFLPGESIPVKVRLVNNSGQTIRFGKEDWLTYSVDGRDGLMVLKTGDAPQPHDFNVQAAEMATTHADLAPYFNITKPGRYTVTATAHIKDWGKDIMSAPKSFDVVTGARFWEQEFGVPQAPDNHREPEVRKYILQQASFSKEMKLYLRVTDASETKTIRLFPIGPMISFSNPEMRVDRSSNLHLLYQESARIYSYTMFNPVGEPLIHQTYYYSTSAPHLKTDDAGGCVIVGGVRHPSTTDLPVSQKTISTNEIPPPVP